MFWFVLFGIELMAGIYFAVFGDWEWTTVGWVLIVVSIINISIICAVIVDNRAAAETYLERKVFYESKTAGSGYEDATFKLRKAELNDELIKEQWYRENMPFFSLWPEEILEFEPIK